MMLFKTIITKYIKVRNPNTITLYNHIKNYFTASLISKGLILLSLPLFTRILKPSEFGNIALFNSYVALLGIIFGLGIRGAIVRYYYELKSDFSAYFSSAVSFVFFMASFLSILSILFIEYFAQITNLNTSILIIIILTSFLSVFYEIFMSYLEASKQSNLHKKISIYKVLLFLSLSIPITLCLETNKEYGQISSYFLVSFCLFIFSAISTRKILKPRLNLVHVKYSIAFGAPIIFHLLSQYILAHFDQLMINNLIGSKETGLYSLAYQIGMIQTFLTAAVIKAWTPIFYDQLNRHNFRAIQYNTERNLSIVLSLSLVFVLFSENIISIFADTRYSQSSKIIPIIICGYVCHYLYNVYVAYSFYSKKTTIVAIGSIIAGLINISLNYYLLPIFGYEIAAWTTLVSYFFLFLINYFFSRYCQNLQVVSFKFLLPYIMLFLCFVIFKHLITVNISLVITRILLNIICISCYILITRKLLKEKESYGY